MGAGDLRRCGQGLTILYTINQKKKRDRLSSIIIIPICYIPRRKLYDATKTKKNGGGGGGTCHKENKK